MIYILFMYMYIYINTHTHTYIYIYALLHCYVMYYASFADFGISALVCFLSPLWSYI